MVFLGYREYDRLQQLQKVIRFIKHLFHHLPFVITGVSTQRRTISDLFALMYIVFKQLLLSINSFVSEIHTYAGSFFFYVLHVT